MLSNTAAPKIIEDARKEKTCSGVQKLKDHWPFAWWSTQMALHHRLSLRNTKSLKAHWQRSKTQCPEKYCSCDEACQFSALYGTLWGSYLGKNLIIGDKYINKRVWFFIHQTVLISGVEKENLLNDVNEVHTSAKWLFNYFKKCVHKTEKIKSCW